MSQGYRVRFYSAGEQPQELVKKGKRPVALFVDEAHDLNGNTLTGL